MTILIGDCLAILPTLPPDSIDAIVTDPPYHLTSIVKRFGSADCAPAAPGPHQRTSKGFMGQTWDGGDIAFRSEVWCECLRVLKPGGHILVMGGSRTHHRMWCAIEDAGFELRETCAWVHGQGFPKSRNVGNGWGTALKPALEMICLARKPLSEKSVAANVLKHGTGAINIDGCRVPTNGEQVPVFTQDGKQKFVNRPQITRQIGTRDTGRWPANICTDGSPEVLELFPTTGPSKAANRGLMNCTRHGGLGDLGTNPRDGTDTVRGHADNGGSAARFFAEFNRIHYCAKASRAERDMGLQDMPAQTTAEWEHDGHPHRNKKATARTNTHPTVKPLSLMRYLCRLITPPGGTVLDPFTGSGSTGVAASQEGFGFIGIELSPDYAATAEQRMASVKRPVAEHLIQVMG